METYSSDLLIIAFVAMLAPFLAELSNRFRLPVVVLEVVLGILIGPYILGLAAPDGMIVTLSELGLTFLLFIVGLEIDFDKIRGKPLSLAINGWLISLTIASICMLFFNTIGLIQTPPLLAAVALSTTAFGVLVPILRDRKELDTKFGTYMIAAAAAGEFGPLIVISMLLIPAHSTILHTLFMLTFIVITLIAANIAINARSSKLIELLTRTMQSSGQLPIRVCILLQILFVTLSAEFGLNVVIGAFTAGILVKLAIKGRESEILHDKLDAIGYGFLIPIFFIVVGMKFELSALWSEPLAPLQIALLAGLLLFIRGLPVVLYKQELTNDEQVSFAFYSATGLPLIIVISEIGVSSGLMPAARAALLVSAGMVSVLLFPILAEKLRGKISLPWLK